MARIILNVNDETLGRLNHAVEYFGMPSRNSLIDQILRESVKMPTTLSDLRGAMKGWYKQWHVEQVHPEEGKNDA